jgi:hypothetical protein
MATRPARTQSATGLGKPSEPWLPAPRGRPRRWASPTATMDYRGRLTRATRQLAYYSERRGCTRSGRPPAWLNSIPQPGAWGQWSHAPGETQLRLVQCRPATGDLLSHGSESNHSRQRCVLACDQYGVKALRPDCQFCALSRTVPGARSTTPNEPYVRAWETIEGDKGSVCSSADSFRARRII